MAALAEHEEYYSTKGSDTPVPAKAAGDRAKAARLTEEAIAMAEAGNLHNAFGLFEQAALANPTDGKLWENLGALRAWCTPTKASV